MTNMIQAAKDQAAALTRAACERAAAAGSLPAGGEGIKAAVGFSRDTSRGDCASSFAMAGAKVLHMPPRAVARAIADNLELEGSCFDRVEIAGPGFLNFTLSPRWYGGVLCAIEHEGADYGSGAGGMGKRALVEFVPAGPMRLDSVRGRVLGDVLANVLARDGWSVRKEFRVNDAGSRDKPEARGFDLAVSIREAGRRGRAASLRAAPDGSGLDGSHRLAVVLTGPVNLLRDGKPAGVSGRTGKAVTLHDLPDGISEDAVRYFFNNRAASGPLDFDLDLAVRQDGGNPLYRVRYAHARICSLLSRLAEEGAKPPAAAAVDAARLSAPEEKALIKSLARYPEELRLAARDLDPSRVNRYLTDLAGDFRRFYNVCRLKEEGTVLPARLKLADAVRAVLANGLNLLGVTAPERM